jgi:hypothetical protein
MDWARWRAYFGVEYSTFLALPPACAEALRPPALRTGPVSPSSRRRRAAPARTTSRCTCSAPCPSGYSTARSCSHHTRHAPVPYTYAGGLGLPPRTLQFALLCWRRSPFAVLRGPVARSDPRRALASAGQAAATPSNAPRISQALSSIRCDLTESLSEAVAAALCGGRPLARAAERVNSIALVALVAAGVVVCGKRRSRKIRAGAPVWG